MTGIFQATIEMIEFNDLRRDQTRVRVEATDDSVVFLIFLLKVRGMPLIERTFSCNFS